jgi:predicted RNase H-like HicB family nuclease
MKHLTAVIHQEELSNGAPMFVSHCPELNITSQGETRAAALDNLREAVEGVLEVATPAEIERRMSQGATVQAFDVAA